MKKFETVAKFVTFVLFGIFTADLIFRFARFIFAYCDAAEEFPKIIGVAVAAVGDTYSGYMLLSIIIVTLLATIGGIFSIFRAHTLIFFALNVTSGLVFIAILNWINIPWNLLLTLAIISFGTYITSCIICETSAAWDIYKTITNHSRRKPDDSTT